MINVYPRVSEKAYGTAKNNVYVFDAPVSANKQQIAEAVEAQHKVKVTSVKTLVQSGKAIRSMTSKRGRPVNANRKDSKKAYVTLAEGHSIKVFDEPEVEAKAKTEKEKK